MLETFNCQPLVKAQFVDPNNLATEGELNEQANIALRAYRDGDLDGNSDLTFNELKRIMGDL